MKTKSPTARVWEQFIYNGPTMFSGRERVSCPRSHPVCKVYVRLVITYTICIKRRHPDLRGTWMGARCLHSTCGGESTAAVTQPPSLWGHPHREASASTTYISKDFQISVNRSGWVGVSVGKGGRETGEHGVYHAKKTGLDCMPLILCIYEKKVFFDIHNMFGMRGNKEYMRKKTHANSLV